MLYTLENDPKISIRATFQILPVVKQNNISVEVKNSPHQFHFLRQQNPKKNNEPHWSLIDFLGQEDYLGIFAVNAGIGVDQWLQEISSENNDYKEILIKAIADRLA